MNVVDDPHQRGGILDQKRLIATLAGRRLRTGHFRPISFLMSDELCDQYIQVLPSLERVRLLVHNKLERLLESHGVRYEKIESRCKGFVSFAEKCSNPNKRYDSPINDVTDLVGFRVIFFDGNDVDSFANVVTKNFEIDWFNSVDKRAAQKLNEFGYQSLHLVCSLRSEDASTDKELLRFKFEIQLRTVLQHAWASISHALHYKSSAEVPAELQRRLYRLAGLLELADSEFTQLQQAKATLTKRLAGIISEAPEVVQLEPGSLAAYLSHALVVKDLTAAAIKAGFHETVAPPEAYIPRIMQVTKHLGIGDIAALDRLLLKFRNHAHSVLTALRRAEGAGSWRASPACFVLFALYACVPNLSKEELEKLGWGTSQTIVDALRIPQQP